MANPKADVVDGSLNPLGYQQLPVSGVVSLTVPTGAKLALIIVETAGVRYRDDSTNPTATVGMPLASGDKFPYNGDLAKIRFIAQSGAPVLNVSYYG